jgi:hypothetical protein
MDDSDVRRTDGHHGRVISVHATCLANTLYVSLYLRGSAQGRMRDPQLEDWFLVGVRKSQENRGKLSSHVLATITELGSAFKADSLDFSRSR